MVRALFVDQTKNMACLSGESLDDKSKMLAKDSLTIELADNFIARFGDPNWFDKFSLVLSNAAAFSNDDNIHFDGDYGFSLRDYTSRDVALISFYARTNSLDVVQNQGFFENKSDRYVLRLAHIPEFLYETVYEFGRFLGANSVRVSPAHMNICYPYLEMISVDGTSEELKMYEQLQNRLQKRYDKIPESLGYVLNGDWYEKVIQ